MPSVPVWSALGDTVLQLMDPGKVPIPDPIKAPLQPSSPPSTKHPPWSWTPPDLTPGGQWWTERVASLQSAISQCAGPASWYDDGIELLKIHANNYGPDGPQRLVVLWWEWPSEQ